MKMEFTLWQTFTPLWKMTIFEWKLTISTKPFSIAMLNYQRVTMIHGRYIAPLVYWDLETKKHACGAPLCRFSHQDSDLVRH